MNRATMIVLAAALAASSAAAAEHDAALARTIASIEADGPAQGEGCRLAIAGAPAPVWPELGLEQRDPVEQARRRLMARGFMQCSFAAKILGK